MADRTGWFAHEQLASIIAVSESTPGPIGINRATCAGFVTAGVPGILIVLIVAAFLDRFRKNGF